MYYKNLKGSLLASAALLMFSTSSHANGYDVIPEGVLRQMMKYVPTGSLVNLSAASKKNLRVADKELEYLKRNHARKVSPVSVHNATMAKRFLVEYELALAEGDQVNARALLEKAARFEDPVAIRKFVDLLHNEYIANLIQGEDNSNINRTMNARDYIQSLVERRNRTGLELRRDASLEIGTYGFEGNREDTVKFNNVLIEMGSLEAKHFKCRNTGEGGLYQNSEEKKALEIELCERGYYPALIDGLKSCLKEGKEGYLDQAKQLLGRIKPAEAVINVEHFIYKLEDSFLEHNGTKDVLSLLTEWQISKGFTPAVLRKLSEMFRGGRFEQNQEEAQVFLASLGVDQDSAVAMTKGELLNEQQTGVRDRAVVLLNDWLCAHPSSPSFFSSCQERLLGRLQGTNGYVQNFDEAIKGIPSSRGWQLQQYTNGALNVLLSLESSPERDKAIRYFTDLGCFNSDVNAWKYKLKGLLFGGNAYQKDIAEALHCLLSQDISFDEEFVGEMTQRLAAYEGEDKEQIRSLVKNDLKESGLDKTLRLMTYDGDDRQGNLQELHDLINLLSSHDNQFATHMKIEGLLKGEYGFEEDVGVARGLIEHLILKFDDMTAKIYKLKGVAKGKYGFEVDPIGAKTMIEDILKKHEEERIAVRNSGQDESTSAEILYVLFLKAMGLGSGSYGYEQDVSEARRIMDKLYREQFAPALQFLAKAVYNGTFGYEQDVVTANSLFEASLKANDKKPSKKYLVEALLNGTNGQVKDYDKARLVNDECAIEYCEIAYSQKRFLKKGPFAIKIEGLEKGKHGYQYHPEAAHKLREALGNRTAMLQYFEWEVESLEKGINGFKQDSRGAKNIRTALDKLQGVLTPDGEQNEHIYLCSEFGLESALNDNNYSLAEKILKESKLNLSLTRILLSQKSGLMERMQSPDTRNLRKAYIEAILPLVETPQQVEDFFQEIVGVNRPAAYYFALLKDYLPEELR